MSPESNPVPPSPTEATLQWRQQQPEIEGDDDDDAEREEDIVEHLQPDNNNGPTHHPSAPPDELFDIPTTVDPSYIISLIRKLLPVNDKQGDDSQEPASLSPEINGDIHSSNGDVDVDAMDVQNGVLRKSPRSSDCPKMLTREEAWEESGCILWDLAANKEHAEFMAQNLVVDVLLANLLTTDSVRVTEISLGIIGNLACHEVVMNQITTTNRFLETIANQVFSDDTPCLCEVCRLLTLGLQGCQSMEWAKALQSDSILSRVLWIAENTLNPTLTEKSVGMLLAIMENQQVVPILLPTLVKLGLPRLLVNLFAFEIEKLTGDRAPESSRRNFHLGSFGNSLFVFLTQGYSALESVLRTIETLSVIDDYSEEICSKKEVVQMAVKLIKFPEKIEISSSCVTAAVLVANLLADAPDLALELSKDLLLLQSLLDLLPFTSDDLEARNALWNVLARLLLRVKDIEMSSLHQYVWAFVSRLGLIEDALLDSEYDKSSGNEEMLTTVRTNLNSWTAAIQCIFNISNQWKSLKKEISEQHDTVLYVDDEDVQKLLNCCHKHGS